jgi:hypothetical protein
MLYALHHYNINSLNDFSKNPRMINYSSLLANNTIEELGLVEYNDDNNIVNDAHNPLSGEIQFDFQNHAISDDEDILNSTKSDFNGIKTVDNIDPILRQSYCKKKINENIQHFHKESACRLLSNKRTKLSSDRLSRIIQQTAAVS